jgi:acetolactate synthase-1/2/3 large subunit
LITIGAQVLVKLLAQHGVTHVFGIPGAKVDSVFEALLDSSIELVLCRHEQNAAFMAIGGEVPLDDRFKHTYQSLDGVDVMRLVTKYAQSALNIHSLPEVFANGVRAAESGRPGAVFLGLS